MTDDQTYWLCLGDLWGGDKYPKAVTDNPKWVSSWMRDDFTTCVLKVTFNPHTGGASVTVEKNIIKDNTQ